MTESAFSLYLHNAYVLSIYYMYRVLSSFFTLTNYAH